MSDLRVVKLLDNFIQFALSLVPGGTYDGATTYEALDVVEYNGSSYLAKQTTTGNLPTNTTYWQLLAEKGDTGPVADEEFETVSKNIKSWDATFSYTGSQLTSISYTDGTDTIVKTFNYTGSQLTSIVLSGDTPSGIELTKTLSYTGSSLTSITYS